jgi:hypothetical protein
MWDAVLEVLEIVADDASNGDKKICSFWFVKAN